MRRQGFKENNKEIMFIIIRGKYAYHLNQWIRYKEEKVEYLLSVLKKISRVFLTNGENTSWMHIMSGSFFVTIFSKVWILFRMSKGWSQRFWERIFRLQLLFLELRSMYIFSLFFILLFYSNYNFFLLNIINKIK